MTDHNPKRRWRLFAMEKLERTTRRLLLDERGVTLTELLVAMSMLIVLLGVVGTVFTAVSRTQPEISERSHQVQEGRNLAEQLTRELREGYDVQTATSSQLTFTTYVRSASCGASVNFTDPAQPAIPCRVGYACVSGTCTRTESTPDGSVSGQAYELVDGLASDQVFAYSPGPTSPRSVTVTLVFPGANSPDGESVTLSDGASLRNPTGAG